MLKITSRSSKSSLRSLLLLVMLVVSMGMWAQQGTRYVCTKTIYGDGTVGKSVPMGYPSVIYLDFTGSERFLIHENWGDAVFGLRFRSGSQLVFEQMAQNNMVGPYIFVGGNCDQYVFSSDKSLLNFIVYRDKGANTRYYTIVYKKQTQQNIGKMYE